MSIAEPIISAPSRQTRHLPELPLPSVADVSADWGLGWHLAQALRQLAAGERYTKPAYGSLMAARCRCGLLQDVALDAHSASVLVFAEIISGGRQRRQITAEGLCEAWSLPRDLWPTVGHINRVSKSRSALGAVEALDDALAALDVAIMGRGASVVCASRASRPPAGAELSLRSPGRARAAERQVGVAGARPAREARS